VAEIQLSENLQQMTDIIREQDARATDNC
jgi:hypothetical protein